MESNIIYGTVEREYLIHARSVGRSGYPVPRSFRQDNRGGSPCTREKWCEFRRYHTQYMMHTCVFYFTSYSVVAHESIRLKPTLSEAFREASLQASASNANQGRAEAEEFHINIVTYIVLIDSGRTCLNIGFIPSKVDAQQLAHLLHDIQKRGIDVRTALPLPPF